MPEGVALRGRILKPDGELAQVLCRLDYQTPWSFSLGGSQYSTNPDGSFERTGINPDVPGEYRLAIDSRAEFVPMHVKVDPMVESNDVKLTKGKVIEGVVIDEATSRPVIGAEVFASCSKGIRGKEDWKSGPYIREMLRAEGPTDEKGRFRFSNLLPEAYNLNVQQSQQIPDIRDVQPGGNPVRLVIRIPDVHHDKVKLGEPNNGE